MFKKIYKLDFEASKNGVIALILFGACVILLSRLFVQLGYDLTGSAMVGIFSASANLAFVFLVVIQLLNQADRLNMQEELIRAEKAKHQPLIDVDTHLRKDEGEIDLNIANKGNNTAKNTQILISIASKDEKILRGFEIDNIGANYTVVDHPSNSPSDLFRVRKAGTYSYSEGEIERSGDINIKDIAADKGLCRLRVYIYVRNSLGEVIDERKVFDKVLQDYYHNKDNIKFYEDLEEVKDPFEHPSNILEKITLQYECYKVKFDDDRELYDDPDWLR